MTESPKTSTDAPEAPQRRSLLSRYRWLVMLLLMIIVLPSLLTVTGRQQSLLNLLHPRLSSAIEFRSAATHWWAPVELAEVRLKDLAADSDGEARPIPLFTATSVTTRQPLWKLALSLGNGAEINVRQPVINIRVHDGRTNLEETITRIFGESDSQSSTMPVSVTVEDGVVRLLPDGPATETTEPSWTTISNINGTFSTLDQSKFMPDVVLVAQIGAAASSATHGSTDQVDRQSGVNPRIAATLDDLAGDSPLIPFTDSQMAVLKSDASEPSLQLQISSAPDRKNVQNVVLEVRRLNLAELEPLIQRLWPGTVCVGEISCRMQAHLLEDGSDEGFAGRLQLAGERIRWRNTAWAVGESLDLDSVTAQGAIAVAQDGLLVKDLHIQSALLDLSGDGEVKMAAQDPLRAIEATAANESTAQRTAFAEAAAAAAGQVRLNGRIDLARLIQMLPRTLNVDESVQAESGELKFSCRIQQEATMPAKAELFAATNPGFRWQLVAESSPIRVLRDGQKLTLDSPLRLDAIGELTTDKVGVTSARLAGAFGSITADPLDDGFTVSGTVNPDRLWNDLRQLVDIPRPGLRNDVQVDARIRLSDSAVQLSALKLVSDEIEILSPDLKIYSGASIVQMIDGTMTLNGAAPALKTLIAPWHSATWLADDTIVTAKLSADPKQHLAVQAVIQRNQVLRNASLYRTISASSAAETDTSFFVIDQGRLDASIVVDSNTGRFLVERGLVEVPGLKAMVSGTLGIDGGLLVMNVDADAEYDLEQLTQQLLSDPDHSIQLTGSGRDIFHLEGSPSLWTATDLASYRASIASETSIVGSDEQSLAKPLQATGRIAWDGGRLYGLPLGPGSAVAELKNGLLRTEPVRCALGSGEVNFMPQWDLNSNILQLAPGSRIQNLEVTPELSREWLGYLAPMLSDAASARGTVSARLQQFDYYVDSPAVSTVHGELTLHNAVASPGQSLSPLIQLIDLVDRNYAGQRRELEFPDQNIPFELRDGMVLHDGLQMQFGDYLMTSRGGVGLDRRVQLTLTVPMEKNVSDPTGSRTLQIPIGGTVDRPQLDTRGLLQNVGQQQLQKQVDQQLNRGLNKLFDKLK